MQNRLRSVTIGCISVALAGCAVTKTQFRYGKDHLTDQQVCNAHFSDAAVKDSDYSEEVSAEMTKRGLSGSACNELAPLPASDGLKAVGAALLIGAAVAAVVAVGRSGGGSGYSAPTYDTQWDWDLIRNNYGTPVWACRGVQTGQFADNYHCDGLLQIDSRWPGL